MKKIAVIAFAALLASASVLRAVEPPATTEAATEAATESAVEMEKAELDRAIHDMRGIFGNLEKALGGLSKEESAKAEELAKKFEGELLADPGSYKTRDGKEAFGERIVKSYREILTAKNAKTFDTFVERAKTVAEKSYNLASVRGIAMACNIYAHDNNGKTPDNLGQLITAGFCAPKQFIKKNSATKIPDMEKMTFGDQAKWVNEHSEYLYLGAGKEAEKLETNFVLLHDKEGTIFGCADDHIPVLTPEEAVKVFAELKAGKNPPPSLKGK